MIAVNKKCYICEFLKSDFACATDYCERGNDDVMFNEEEEDNPCTLFKQDDNKLKEL